MKPMLLKIPFYMLIFICSCSGHKTASTKIEPSALQQKTFHVNYNAISRKVFENITFNNQKMKVSLNRNNSSYQMYQLAPERWKMLLSLAAKINLDQLSNFKPPTSKRLYDGAAHAKVTFGIGKNSISSQSFDHRRPPLELKELVDYILSLKEEIEEKNFK